MGRATVAGRRGVHRAGVREGAWATGRISGLWPRRLWGAPPGYVLIVVSLSLQARAQRRIDDGFDELAGAYADDVEHLERTFGLYLRDHHPRVAAAHGKDRLEFRDDGGASLVLELTEPLRGPLGWGGARLQGWRQGKRVALPATDLFLTLARGLHPEWVAHWPGAWRRRLAVVNEQFIAHAAELIFGPPSPTAAAQP